MSLTCLLRMQHGTVTLQKVWQFLASIHLLFDLVLSLLGICAGEIKNLYSDTHTHKLHANVCCSCIHNCQILGKKYPSVEHKLWYIHLMKYYLAIFKNPTGTIDTCNNVDEAQHYAEREVNLKRLHTM